MAFEEQRNLALVEDSDSDSYDAHTQYAQTRESDAPPLPNVASHFVNPAPEESLTESESDESESGSTSHTPDDDDPYAYLQAQGHNQLPVIHNLQQQSASVMVVNPSQYQPQNALRIVQQSASVMAVNNNNNYNTNNRAGFSQEALQQVQQQLQQSRSAMGFYNNNSAYNQPQQSQLQAPPSNYMQQMQQQSASVMHMHNSDPQQQMQTLRQVSQSARHVRAVNNSNNSNNSYPQPPSTSDLAKMQQQSMSARIVNDSAPSYQRPPVKPRRVKPKKISARKPAKPSPMATESSKQPLYHQSPKRNAMSHQIYMDQPPDSPPLIPKAPKPQKKKNEVRIVIKGKYDGVEEEQRKKRIRCKVIIGIVLGVLSVLCVLAAWNVDEITKENIVTGTFVCGHDVQFVCLNSVEGECQNTFIFALDMQLNVTETMDFETLCTSEIETELNRNACTQISAGNLFYFANIISMVLGVLGILLLCIACTRHVAIICFLFAAVCATVAFAGYLAMSDGSTCWDAANVNVEMAASCWFDIIATVLFGIASIVSCGTKRKR
eukprot:223734_1